MKIWQSKVMGIIGSIFILLFTAVAYISIFFPLLGLEFKSQFSVLGFSFFIMGGCLVSFSFKFIANQTYHASIFTNYLKFVILWVLALLLPGVIEQLVIIKGYVNVGSYIFPLLFLFRWLIFFIALLFLIRSFDGSSKVVKHEFFKLAGYMYLIAVSFLFFMGVLFELAIQIAFEIVLDIFLISGVFLLIAPLFQVIAFSLLPEKFAI